MCWMECKVWIKTGFHQQSSASSKEIGIGLPSPSSSSWPSSRSTTSGWLKLPRQSSTSSSCCWLSEQGIFLHPILIKFQTLPRNENFKWLSYLAMPWIMDRIRLCREDSSETWSTYLFPDHHHDYIHRLTIFSSSPEPTGIVADSVQ